MQQKKTFFEFRARLPTSIALRSVEKKNDAINGNYGLVEVWTKCTTQTPIFLKKLARGKQKPASLLSSLQPGLDRSLQHRQSKVADDFEDPVLLGPFSLTLSLLWKSISLSQMASRNSPKKCCSKKRAELFGTVEQRVSSLPLPIQPFKKFWATSASVRTYGVCKDVCRQQQG